MQQLTGKRVCRDSRGDVGMRRARVVPRGSVWDRDGCMSRQVAELVYREVGSWVTRATGGRSTREIVALPNAACAQANLQGRAPPGTSVPEPCLAFWVGH